MIDLDTHRNHTFDFYLDKSFCEREYFSGDLINMRIVKGNFTSVTKVIHGVSIIFIKGYDSEMKRYRPKGE